ncbi:Satratoxin biosynthesis SC1 cluster protein 4 [Colletotrichum sp. SAR 10_70]|nr:Satratoxin biosynthesis SC1 cluster protein 4 [Colletotrichum sp. SAR 10_71]KAI8178771.1 Satratoxin biosynthesis SC1 cluster protein 4 [Colletotrichum sp. SAR 10_75]KAI8183817.1 Satratoxin biosynthesis SC1 cluster protein 4 [Colletotrichum sp. SAR 10_65]KAI8189727.1 Satratoxin biosynthesis SC1 cluster protein 4 [Colletotrichum sp. SAR 10_70]
MAAFRFLVLLACFLGLSSYVAAADLSYNGIPPCAISCILQEIGAGHSTCALTNQTCMCNDKVLAGYVQTCVMANCTVKEMLAEETGAGRDIWSLKPEQITYFLVLFYVFGMLYLTALAFVKASILFLYLRIFPDEKFRRVLWCTQVFNLLLLIAFVGGTVGSCQPIHYFWDGWTGEMKGQCINLNAFAMCHGALNVALDVWMLVLPATQVYDLRMPLMRKLGVMLMFGVGVFLTAVSAYRIKALLIFSTSYNVTVDSFQSSLWSHIELCVGIFVACLPSTRQVWRILFPKIVTQLSRTGRSAKGSNNESQASRTISSPPERARVVSYEEASIAHLVGDFRNIDLNDLPSEPDTPSTPKTPKSRSEFKEEPCSGSSRGNDSTRSMLKMKEEA